MVMILFILADNSDMVVCTIECRPHQVSHGGIESDIVLVLLGDMQHLAHQVSIWTGDHPSALKDNLQRIKTSRYDDLIVESLHSITDHLQIHCILIRTVGNTDATTHIDEFNDNSCFLLDSHCQVKEHPCRLNNIGTIKLV